jgi:hypothetical protein
MKKLLVVVVLGVVGYVVYAFVLRSPEKRTCAHMAELCGLDQGGGEVARCRQALDALKKSNAAAVEHVNACVAEAKSCGETAGCASGAAWSIGAGLLNDFLSGLRR